MFFEEIKSGDKISITGILTLYKETICTIDSVSDTEITIKEHDIKFDKKTGMEKTGQRGYSPYCYINFKN